MPNTTITPQEKEDNMVRNIIAREYEVDSYQINIDNYSAMLLTLPTVWPPELLQYKGLTTQNIAEQVPVSDIQMVTDLIFQEKVAISLKTEMIEQIKASHIHKALISQMEPATLSGKLAAGKIAYEAAAALIE